MTVLSSHFPQLTENPKLKMKHKSTQCFSAHLFSYIHYVADAVMEGPIIRITDGLLALFCLMQGMMSIIVALSSFKDLWYVVCLRCFCEMMVTERPISLKVPDVLHCKCSLRKRLETPFSMCPILCWPSVTQGKRTLTAPLSATMPAVTWRLLHT